MASGKPHNLASATKVELAKEGTSQNTLTEITETTGQEEGTKKFESGDEGRNPQSWQGAYSRVLIDCGAAVAAVPLGFAKEYRREPSDRYFVLRNVGGGSIAHHGRQTIDCEPTTASGHTSGSR